jgi:copper chaperone CopZ
VRSALLAVPGVTRARVTLDGHEAVVTYDPHVATVPDLIAAVARAEAPAPELTYRAAVKPAR